MYHFSRNIISASFGEGYINLNPLSAANTPPRRRPGGFLLFLSNHFLSIFRCQDPSWLTSAGSIWVPYRPVFPTVSPWHLTDKCVVRWVYVETADFSADTWHLARASRPAVPMEALYLLNAFLFHILIEDFMSSDLRQRLMAHRRLLLTHRRRKTTS